MRGRPTHILGWPLRIDNVAQLRPRLAAPGACPHVRTRLAAVVLRRLPSPRAVALLHSWLGASAGPQPSSTARCGGGRVTSASGSPTTAKCSAGRSSLTVSWELSMMSWPRPGRQEATSDCKSVVHLVGHPDALRAFEGTADADHWLTDRVRATCRIQEPSSDVLVLGA